MMSYRKTASGAQGNRAVEGRKKASTHRAGPHGSCHPASLGGFEQKGCKQMCILLFQGHVFIKDEQAMAPPHNRKLLSQEGKPSCLQGRTGHHDTGEAGQTALLWLCACETPQDRILVAVGLVSAMCAGPESAKCRWVLGSSSGDLYWKLAIPSLSIL